MVNEARGERLLQRVAAAIDARRDDFDGESETHSLAHQCLELLRWFVQISDADQRKSLITTARTMAS